MHSLIEDILRSPSGRQEESAIIQTGSGQYGFTYSQLNACVTRLRYKMEAAGLSEGSVCCLMLQNSAAFVASFLATIDLKAMTAPLNPASKKGEIEFSLKNLGADLLVGPKGFHQTAAELDHDCALAECYWDGEKIAFDVVRPRQIKASKSNVQTPANNGDFVALALHTSGTTGTPKAVPLLQSNLYASANNVVEAYSLAPKDRSMLIMPLFHIHGIVAGLLAPLMCGSCIIIPEKGLGPDFWDDFAKHQATWWTATPTHQKIILTFPRPPAGVSPRFIRSCSSPLPPTVLRQLEEAFSAPVLEAYAMTENAHHIASNLETGPRSPGSVGKPCAGVSLKVIGDNEEQLPASKRGEIVIKGPSVTPGYLRNPEANAKGFTSDGFFRTGDQGELDENGHLWLTGRLKEIINKGGEKISPNELDNVILEHPAVSGAVSFGVPDDIYGEDVGAAVVPKKGEEVTPAALKRWLRERVSAFRVPREVWVIDAVPLTATGKIQRGEVAKLMLAKEAGIKEPAGADVASIKSLWAKTLGMDESEIKESDQYFDIGGDSVSAIRLATAAKAAGLGLDPATVFRFPILSEMAKQCPASKSKLASTMANGQKSPADLLNACAEASAVNLSEVEDVAPATDLQQVIAWSNRLSGAWVATLKFACHNISLAQLETAVEAVRQRHHILRARTVILNDKFYNVVVRDRAIWETSTSLPVYLAQVEDAHFQYGCPQVRYGYINDANEGPFVVLTMTHTVGDVWSRKLFYDELSQGLKDVETLRTQPAPTSYLRFAEAVARVDADAAKKYHASVVDGFERWSYLSHEGAAAHGTVEDTKTLIKDVDLPNQADETRYAQVLKVHLAWALTLSSISSDKRIYFPSITSGRLFGLPGIETAMGPAIAMTPIALDLEGDLKVTDVLETLRSQLFDGVEYESLAAANTMEHFGTEERETVLNCSEVGEENGMVIEGADGGYLKLQIDKPLYGKMSVDYHMRVSERSGGLSLHAAWRQKRLGQSVVEDSLERFADCLRAVAGARPSCTIEELRRGLNSL